MNISHLYFTREETLVHVLQLINTIPRVPDYEPTPIYIDTVNVHA